MSRNDHRAGRSGKVARGFSERDGSGKGRDAAHVQHVPDDRWVSCSDRGGEVIAARPATQTEAHEGQAQSDGSDDVRITPPSERTPTRSVAAAARSPKTPCWRHLGGGDARMSELDGMGDVNFFSIVSALCGCPRTCPRKSTALPSWVRAGRTHSRDAVTAIDWQERARRECAVLVMP